MWHSSRHFLLYCHNSYKLFVRLIVHHPFSFCFVLLDSLQVEVFILYFWISYKLCVRFLLHPFFMGLHTAAFLVGELFSPLFWEIIQAFLCLFHSFAVELFLLILGIHISSFVWPFHSFTTWPQILQKLFHDQ